MHSLALTSNSSNLILFLNIFSIFAGQLSILLVFRRYRTIKWISPLVSILFFQLLLHFVCCLNERVEEVNILKVGVQILLSDFQLLQQAGREVIFGHLWEGKLLLEDLHCWNFVLIEVICALSIGVNQFISDLDWAIKVFFGQSLAEFIEWVL